MDPFLRLFRATRVSRFMGRTRGASLIGYLLAIGLIAAAAIVSVSLTGTGVERLLTRTSNGLSEAEAGRGGDAPGNSAPVWVTDATLPMGTVGQSYSTSVLATDPDGDPVSYQVTSGALPGGLSLSDSTIHGTPTTGGVHAFTVTAKDSRNAVASRAFTIDINTPPVLTSTAIPSAAPNTPYSHQLEAFDADNDDLTFSATGLPDGFTLQANGELVGESDTTPMHQVTVTVIDAHGASDVRSFDFIVNTPPEWQTPAGELTTVANVGVAYSVAVEADDTDTPIVYDIVSGALPQGLALNTDGTITGEPEVAGEVGTFTVRATDAAGAVSLRTFAIRVNTNPVWDTPEGRLPLARKNVAWSFEFEAHDAESANLTYTMLDPLPAGITQHEFQSNRLQGTPTQGGVYELDVRVSDGKGGSADRRFEIFVNTPPAWVSEGEVGPIQAPGQPIETVQLQATDPDVPAEQTLTFTKLDGPEWISVSSSGEVTGTPAGSGVHNFTVRVSDGVESVDRTLAIRVNTPPTIQIAEDDLPTFAVGASYNEFTFAAAGTDPDTAAGQELTWSVTSGSLPAGLSLDPETGKFIGAAEEAGGPYTVTITVNDGFATDSRTYTFSVVGGCSFDETVIGFETADKTFTVPESCTHILVKVWGAGGGSSSRTGTGGTAFGGGGAFVSAVVPVTPGSTLIALVGQGGASAPQMGAIGFGGAGGRGFNRGGGGGGLSGLFTSTPSPDAWDNVVIVAGGGGGASFQAGSVSGPGRSSNGVPPGLSSDDSGFGMTGGNGAELGVSSGNGGGGGGGGYTGGRGGNHGNSTAPWGGLGGSSYVPATASAVVREDGSGANPGGMSDEHYVAGIGVASGTKDVRGGNGLIVILPPP